jgi:hypothetical protein
VSIFLSTIVTLITTIWYSVPGWYLVPAIVWLWNIWDAVSLVKGKKQPVIIIVAAMLIMGYGIGWQVTQIDPSALTKNLDRASSIIRPMFNPDFITHRADTNSAWAPIEVPCGPTPPPASNTVNGITVSLSPDCGNIGDVLILQASGLWPDTQTEVYWSTPIGDRQPMGEGHITPLLISSDSQGNLNAAIQVPQTHCQQRLIRPCPSSTG